jgi:hypothetical protein
MNHEAKKTTQTAKTRTKGQFGHKTQSCARPARKKRYFYRPHVLQK